MNSFSNTLEALQDIERSILKEFIRICSKHQLRYYLIEGSLLGAVRHEGMIPWDDDIDVAMFREDYERFLSIAPAELESAFELRSYRYQPGAIDCMAKIIHRDHRVESVSKEKTMVTNVWIDLFVIDGMPRGKLLQSIHKLCLLSTKMWLMWSDLTYYVTPRKRAFYEQALIWLARKGRFSRWISTSKSLKRLDRLMASVPVRPDGNCVIFLSEYRFRTLVPVSAYGTRRTARFDGMIVSIPEEAELLLKQEYGDYMKLPAEQERYKHRLRLLPPLAQPAADKEQRHA